MPWPSKCTVSDKLENSQITPIMNYDNLIPMQNLELPVNVNLTRASGMNFDNSQLIESGKIRDFQKS